MNTELWLDYLTDQWQHTGYWEMVAVLFGVLEVLLAYRNSVWLYPCGIISVSIFIWLFLRPEVGLYADASLNVYYLIMSCYGWYLWTKRRHHREPELPITFCTAAERERAFDIFAVSFILIYVVLRLWTPSVVPLADSFTSAVAWSGMWLLARRKVENWLVLNLSNAALVPLLLYKKMPLTALLTVVLFVVAIFGYIRWRRLARDGGDTNKATDPVTG